MPTPNLGLAAPTTSLAVGWIARLKADLGLIDPKVPWIRSSAPPAPLTTGMLWLDTTFTPPRVKMYNGTIWQTIGGNVPVCRVRRTTTLVGVANNSDTQIGVFDTEDEDTDNVFTAGANAIIVPIAGHYDVSGYSEWTANVTGGRRLAITVGAVTLGNAIGISTIGGSTANWNAVVNVNVSNVPLAANDSLALLGRQDSGGTLTAANAGLRYRYVGP